MVQIGPSDGAMSQSVVAARGDRPPKGRQRMPGFPSDVFAKPAKSSRTPAISRSPCAVAQTRFGLLRNGSRDLSFTQRQEV